MCDFDKVKILEIIKQQLKKIDIYSLLKIVCPKDEFDNEAEMISNRIKCGMDFKQIALIMRDVFCEMFDDDFPLDIFIDSSKIVEYELNKSIC